MRGCLWRRVALCLGIAVCMDSQGCVAGSAAPPNVDSTTESRMKHQVFIDSATAGLQGHGSLRGCISSLLDLDAGRASRVAPKMSAKALEGNDFLPSGMRL